MYFYKDKGKQVLDLTGNLILSHNDALVKARVKSAGPSRVRNAQFVTKITTLSFRRKITLTFTVLGFIWGKSEALKPEDKEAEQ